MCVQKTIEMNGRKKSTKKKRPSLKNGELNTLSWCAVTVISIWIMHNTMCTHPKIWAWIKIELIIYFFSLVWAKVPFTSVVRFVLSLLRAPNLGVFFFFVKNYRLNLLYLYFLWKNHKTKTKSSNRKKKKRHGETEKNGNGLTEARKQQFEIKIWLIQNEIKTKQKKPRPTHTHTQSHSASVSPKNVSEEMRNKQRIKLDFLATHRIIMTSNNSNYYHEIARFYYENRSRVWPTPTTTTTRGVGGRASETETEILARAERAHRHHTAVLNGKSRNKNILTPKNFGLCTENERKRMKLIQCQMTWYTYHCFIFHSIKMKNH